MILVIDKRSGNVIDEITETGKTWAYQVYGLGIYFKDVGVMTPEEEKRQEEANAGRENN